MTGFYVKTKDLYYYKCQKKCIGVNVSAKKLHDAFLELLKSYQLDLSELENEILPEIMQYKLLELSKEDANEISATKSRITQVKKDLEVIEERYATGKIDALIYTKFSEKYKTELAELEQKLMNPHMTSSNLKKCIKNGLEIARKLSNLWESADVFGKHKLQHILFPNGFTYDKQNGRVLTFRTNILIELTRCFSDAFKEIKNGDSINFDQISARVTPEIEKSNFYRDLENIEEYKICSK